MQALCVLGLYILCTYLYVMSIYMYVFVLLCIHMSIYTIATMDLFMLVSWCIGND